MNFSFPEVKTDWIWTWNQSDWETSRKSSVMWQPLFFISIWRVFIPILSYALWPNCIPAAWIFCLGWTWKWHWRCWNHLCYLCPLPLLPSLLLVGLSAPAQLQALNNQCPCVGRPGDGKLMLPSFGSWTGVEEQCWLLKMALSPPLCRVSEGTESSCRVLAAAAEQHKSHIENGCWGSPPSLPAL